WPEPSSMSAEVSSEPAGIVPCALGQSLEVLDPANLRRWITEPFPPQRRGGRTAPNRTATGSRNCKDGEVGGDRSTEPTHPPHFSVILCRILPIRKRPCGNATS